MSIAQTTPPWNTIELDRALDAVAARALTTFPEQRARIERATDLVRADAVTDLTHVTPCTWSVTSAANPTQTYTVVSRQTTTCTCPNYAAYGFLPGYACKHGWAVLLVRALRREANKPRLRHAYHMASGEEGHVRLLGQGRAEFFPGGRKYSFVCQRDELCIGPHI
jgi:SWIM zinc finger